MISNFGRRTYCRSVPRIAFAALFVLVCALAEPGAIAARDISSAGSQVSDATQQSDDESHFIFVPYPVTEPALGDGLLAGPVWMRTGPKIGDGPIKPQAYGFGGLWTDGGSRGGFAFDERAWGDGTWRTTVLAARVDLRLKYPGLLPGSNKSTGFNLRAQGISLAAERLLGRGPNSVSVSVFSGTTEVAFGASLPPELSRARRNTNVTRVTLTWSHDRRDDVFMPSSGQAGSVALTTYPEALGSGFDAQRLGVKWMGYKSGWGPGVFGVHAQLDLSYGSPPFYLRPYISLRGIPALEYPGEQVGSVEAEYRIPLNERWDVLAFGGLGTARADIHGLTAQKSVSTAGAGIRFKVQKLFGLTFGVDVAHGPDGSFVYLQIGNAWSK